MLRIGFFMFLTILISFLFETETNENGLTVSQQVVHLLYFHPDENSMNWHSGHFLPNWVLHRKNGKTAIVDDVLCDHHET